MQISHNVERLLKANDTIDFRTYHHLNQAGLNSFERLLLSLKMNPVDLVSVIKDILDKSDCNKVEISLNNPPTTYEDAILGWYLPLLLEKIK